MRGFLFRFGFVYWTSFCVPLMAGELPGLGWLSRFFDAAQTQLTRFSAQRFVHLQLDIHPTGSGDTTADWVRTGCFLALSLIVAAAWTLADKREHPRLVIALRILIRYSLGVIMLSYGTIKLLGGQFPPPGVGRLLETYGDSSPMGLLWTFMGASRPYVFFSGAAETLGALLVLFRRTTTLGALILTAVLANVVALNFFYDVPVKINSTHYLVMSMYLLLPDVRRLADVFLFNRGVAPADQSLVLPHRWMQITRRVLKYGLLALLAGIFVQSAREMVRPRPTPFLDGLWNVTRFSRNGQEVPALVDDATRWRRLKFDFVDGALYMRWHFMNVGKKSQLFLVATDEHSLSATTVQEDGAAPVKFRLTYTRIDDNHFRVEGDIAPDHLAVELERVQAKDQPLVSRGFHWINEDPYNQ